VSGFVKAFQRPTNHLNEFGILWKLLLQIGHRTVLER
jgi:hypothetical protein